MLSSYVDPLKKPFSQIGLGCVTFGREIGKKDAFLMMDYAIAHGITFFDTAAAYGNGSSERIVGDWLRRRGAGAVDQVIVASKAVPPFAKKELEASVGESLRRLGVECLDLLYLHRWDTSLLKDDVIETLEQLVSSGKVKMLGASNFNAGQLRELLDRQQKRHFSPIRSIQNNKNLAVDEVDPSLHAFSAAHKMALVTYSPLGAGFLTGKYAAGIPVASRFSLMPAHQAIYFQPEVLERAAKLHKVASKTGYSLVHLALAWVLHQPGITTVLVGGRTTGHLKQAFEALNFDDTALLAELAPPR